MIWAFLFLWGMAMGSAWKRMTLLGQLLSLAFLGVVAWAACHYGGGLVTFTLF